MAFFEDLFADLTQCADTSDLDGLPTLDFDCSTLTTTTTTSLEPGTTITPSMDTIPISIAPDANQVPFYQGSDTQSDEIKNLLTAMSSRLTDLEMAVSAGNAQISQVGFNLDMALPRVLGLADEFRSAVDALRNSVKDFARGLINHLLTCRIEGDVETGIVT